MSLLQDWPLNLRAPKQSLWVSRIWNWKQEFAVSRLTWTKTEHWNHPPPPKFVDLLIHFPSQCLNFNPYYWRKHIWRGPWNFCVYQKEIMCLERDAKHWFKWTHQKDLQREPSLIGVRKSLKGQMSQTSCPKRCSKVKWWESYTPVTFQKEFWSNIKIFYVRGWWLEMKR